MLQIMSGIEKASEMSLSFSENFCEVAEIEAFEIITGLDTMNLKTQLFDYVSNQMRSLTSDFLKC
jgi:hypothetical protein